MRGGNLQKSAGFVYSQSEARRRGKLAGALLIQEHFSFKT